MNLDNISLKNFTQLCLDEHKMVLSWRNCEDVKKWMYTNHNITLDEHLAFIEKLKSSSDMLYFLVKGGEQNIAVLDFTNFNSKESSSYFGLYANPFIKYAGVGRVLEEVALDYATNILNLQTLKLEVFSANIAVINLHKKYGFTIFATKEVNSLEVTCMEKGLT
ncbi:MAG: UDP-4-amino-4,6-dideoxy-N-acetyl-beta-L-altrosamine N-acetyltransferase [Campylobacterota bacterium]|nr:UDP-4-amino-4,6-dideoxy-N-acetyl-beta-L-altrosamine N-acetyltransferase [Campylobacterota bacterium]